LKLAEPFETLLSEEIRQAAARKAEADLSRAVDEAFRERDNPNEPGGEVALIGAGARSGTLAAAHAVQGLKEKTMVGRTGLEPVTPCASCKCATNCANGPSAMTLPLG
jgi:hypothetical protein